MAIRLLQTSRVTEFARNQDLLSEMLSLFTCQLSPAQPSPDPTGLLLPDLKFLHMKQATAQLPTVLTETTQVDQKLNCSLSKRRKSFRDPPEGSFLSPWPRIKNGYCPYLKVLTAQYPSKRSHFSSTAWGEVTTQELESPNSLGKASFLIQSIETTSYLAV